MTKLLVSGGRDFDDVDFMVDVLSRMVIYCDDGISEVITGEADGADTIAKEWADVMEITHTGFPVTDSDWNRHGMKAAMLRNEEMLEYGPDKVVAFPGGGGTQHMIDISREVPWVEVIHCERLYFNNRNRDYGFLSNFAEGYDFADDDGLWWKTAEHYYQAHKSLDHHEQFTIQDAPTAARAKELGGKVRMKRDDWATAKLDVMRKAIKYKFSKGSDAAERLLNTGFKYLIEYAPWGDSFWGVNSDKVGHNHLGRILNERKFQL